MKLTRVYTHTGKNNKISFAVNEWSKKWKLELLAKVLLDQQLEKV